MLTSETTDEQTKPTSFALDFSKNPQKLDSGETMIKTALRLLLPYLIWLSFYIMLTNIKDSHKIQRYHFPQREISGYKYEKKI